MLVGRSEGFLVGREDIRATIDRLVAFADAGADCLYAPGVRDPAHIRAIVAAVAPRPVNVLLRGPDMRAAELEAMGVRRASVGGSLARISWSAFDAALVRAAFASFPANSSNHPILLGCYRGGEAGCSRGEPSLRLRR